MAYGDYFVAAINHCFKFYYLDGNVDLEKDKRRPLTKQFSAEECVLVGHFYVLLPSFALVINY